jgi:acetate kinase
MSGSGAPPRQDQSELARKADASQDVVLVLNAGSSSIKFAVYSIGGDGPDRLTHGEIEGIGALPSFHARDASGAEIAGMPWTKDANFSVHKLIEALINWIEERFGRGRIMAAGHRVVLGGLEHTAPVLLDAALLGRLRALVPLAPMHQPRNLEPIEALAKLNPNMPQVACFDTAFHRTIPEVAQLYGLPRPLTEAGARRYGFHGLSYEYIASVLPRFRGHTAGFDRTRRSRRRDLLAEIFPTITAARIRLGQWQARSRRDRYLHQVCQSRGSALR